MQHFCKVQSMGIRHFCKAQSKPMPSRPAIANGGSGGIVDSCEEIMLPVANPCPRLQEDVICPYGKVHKLVRSICWTGYLCIIKLVNYPHQQVHGIKLDNYTLSVSRWYQETHSQSVTSSSNQISARWCCRQAGCSLGCELDVPNLEEDPDLSRCQLG